MTAIHIPRPNLEEDVPGLGKVCLQFPILPKMFTAVLFDFLLFSFYIQIFIGFASHITCWEAKEALSGRKIMGRVIIAAFYDQRKFQEKQFERLIHSRKNNFSIFLLASFI